MSNNVPPTGPSCPGALSEAEACDPALHWLVAGDAYAAVHRVMRAHPHFLPQGVPSRPTRGRAGPVGRFHPRHFLAQAPFRLRPA